MLKKITAILILVAVMSGSLALLPQKAMAQESGSLMKVITEELTNLGIYTGIVKTGSAVVSKPAATLGVPMYDPLKSYEMTTEKSLKQTTETKSKILSAMFDVVLQTLKKKLLDMIVDQIVLWIQGGGTPSFVTDWKGFLNKAGKIAFDSAIMQTDAAQLCSPFKVQMKVALLPVNSFYKDEVKCTLDDVVGNVTDFYDDFRKGGWIAYGKSWEPQNNFAMQLLLADDEVVIRTQEEKSARQNESTSAKGFLSVKKCAPGAQDQNIYNSCMAQSTGVGPTNANAALMKQCQEKACTKWDIVTPGSFAGDLLAKSAGAKYFEQIIGSKDLAAYTSAIVNASLNRMMTEGISLIKGEGNTDTADTYTAPLADAMTNLQEKDKQAVIEQYQKVIDERSAVLASKTAELVSMQQTAQVYGVINDNNCAPMVPQQSITDLQTSIASSTQEVASVQKQVSDVTKLLDEAKAISPEYRIREMDLLMQHYNEFVNNNVQLIGYAASQDTRTTAAADAKTKADALASAQSRLTICMQLRQFP